LQEAFGDQPNTGDIRGGKGLLGGPGELKFAARLKAGMLTRGVITRPRGV